MSRDATTAAAPAAAAPAAAPGPGLVKLSGVTSTQLRALRRALLGSDALPPGSKTVLDEAVWAAGVGGGQLGWGPLRLVDGCALGEIARARLPRLGSATAADLLAEALRWEVDAARGACSASDPELPSPRAPDPRTDQEYLESVAEVLGATLPACWAPHLPAVTRRLGGTPGAEPRTFLLNVLLSGADRVGARRRSALESGAAAEPAVAGPAEAPADRPAGQVGRSEETAARRVLTAVRRGETLEPHDLVPVERAVDALYVVLDAGRLPVRITREHGAAALLLEERWSAQDSPRPTTRSTLRLALLEALTTVVPGLPAWSHDEESRDLCRTAARLVGSVEDSSDWPERWEDGICRLARSRCTAVAGGSAALLLLSLLLDAADRLPGAALAAEPPVSSGPVGPADSEERRAVEARVHPLTPTESGRRALEKVLGSGLGITERDGGLLVALEHRYATAASAEALLCLLRETATAARGRALLRPRSYTLLSETGSVLAVLADVAQARETARSRLGRDVVLVGDLPADWPS